MQRTDYVDDIQNLPFLSPAKKKVLIAHVESIESCGDLLKFYLSLIEESPLSESEANKHYDFYQSYNKLVDKYANQPNVLKSIKEQILSKLKQLIQSPKSTIVDDFIVVLKNAKVHDEEYNRDYIDIRSIQVFLEKLKKQGINLESIVDSNGNTLLHLAIANHVHPHIICLLLDYGIDPNIKNKRGNTALHFAAKADQLSSDEHHAMIQMLLKKNSRLDIQNDNGETPLHSSLDNNHSFVLDMFLKHLPKQNKASVLNTPNNTGETVMTKAVKVNDQVAIQSLLKAGMGITQDEIIILNKLKKEISIDTQIDLEFNRLIMINFNRDSGAKSFDALKRKWDQRHVEQAETMTSGELMSFDGLSLSDLYQDQSIKICLKGHHFYGIENIGEGESETITLLRLAEQLEKLIGDPLKNNVVINLVCCYAGKGQRGNARYDTGKNSFAAKLQFELAQKGIHIAVIASQDIIRTATSSGDKTYSSNQNNRFESKKPGSRLIFLTRKDDGNQIKVDAKLFGSWRKNVIKRLKFMRDNSSNTEKKLFIQTWLDQFTNQNNKTPTTSQEIYNTIVRELKDENSVLKQHGFFSSLFSVFTPPNTSHIHLETLLNQWSAIKSHPNTVQHVIKTGHKIEK